VFLFNYLIFIGMNTLTCRICKEQVLPKIMSIHLRSHHQTKFLDYVKDNLDDFRQFGWTECQCCGNITQSHGKKGRACSIECMAKLRETWVGETAPNYGNVVSEESKSKMAEKRKIWHENNEHPLLGKFHSQETKNKMSAIKIGMYDGKNNPMYGKHHTPETIKKIFSFRRMNKLEKLVADTLDSANIKYKFQFFINDGNVCRSYDFKIKHKPLILEIDGDYWHGNPNIKSHYFGVEKIKANDLLKERMANTRGYKVIRFWESDIKKDVSIIKTRLMTEGILTS
jgi:very-short-patch-repair endonuclease